MSTQLEDAARRLLPILRRQARRPYIIELAGTPKAGKTTTLQVLSRFMKECGYQVQQMRERASDCPIAMKGHFFFNTWTTTTMLASMIEAIESEADVLFMDRGVFDALVWLEVQSQEHQVTSNEYEVFRQFVMLERWRTLTDLTVVFHVEPSTALERENKDLLIKRTGSIMSPANLGRYNRVLNQVRQGVASDFQFYEIDTTDYDSPVSSTERVATEIINRMEAWADPEIAVVPRSIVKAMFGEDKIKPLPEELSALTDKIVFKKRSTLEHSDEYVGFVSAAMLMHEGNVLLLRRTEERDEKRAAYGPDILWKGCHVPHFSSGKLIDQAVGPLKSRLREDFHLGRLDSEPIPRWLVWNGDDERDSRHIGVFYQFNIDTPEVANPLASKVFKRERNRTKLSSKEFVAPHDLQSRTDVTLESWSQEVLRRMLAGGQ